MAGFWKRAWGLVIDAVILSAPEAFVQIIVGAAFGSDAFPRGGFGTESTGNLVVRALVSLLSAIAFFAYPAWFIGNRKQTIGMKAVGIEAIDFASGASLSKRQAWQRAIFVFLVVDGLPQINVALRFFNDHPNKALSAGYLLTPIGATLALLVYSWSLWDRHNQTLQDKVVGSVVVLTEST